jgi:hypothetical protein
MGRFPRGLGGSGYVLSARFWDLYQLVLKTTKQSVIFGGVLTMTGMVGMIGSSLGIRLRGQAQQFRRPAGAAGLGGVG